MPEALLIAYLHQIGSIRAKESIHSYNIAIAGSGSLEKTALSNMISQWEMESRDFVKIDAPRPRNRQELASVLSASGIVLQIASRN